MMRTHWALAGSMVLALVGCGTSSSGGGSTASPNYGSTLSPGASVDLAACTSGMTARQVDENLAIVFDLEQSYHEMVACGGLVGALAGALVDVLESLVESPSGGLPRGFSREGGTYIAAPGGGSNTQMQAQFMYGDDYAAGERGEVVSHNVFALGSYLENPRVDIDYTTGELLIRYGARGPLVELLGFGAEPPRPLRLSPSDLGGITREIEKLKVQTTVDVDDQREISTVVYTLESAPIGVGEILSGGSFAFDVVTSAAAHSDLPQEMQTLSWAVDYDDRARGLDGDITFAMEGGDFDYGGVFRFERSTWPETSVHCLD